MGYRNEKRVGILACGASLPSTVRRNDDPIFSSIVRETGARSVMEADAFTGVHERRVLGKDEDIVELAGRAGCRALEKAIVLPHEIDRLYGYVSVSDYLAPNALFAVHAYIGLPMSLLVVPINSEYSNFLVSLVQAWESIQCGHSRKALVTCAVNWTAHMDYTQGHSMNVGDGAGAALVGEQASFVFVDYAMETLSNRYGVMTMKLRPSLKDSERQYATYRIEPEAGMTSYVEDGMGGPVRLIKGLLERNGLVAQETALFTHQASRILLDHWETQIRPARIYETLERYGNMTFATVPVNLAHFWDEISEDYVVLHALGVGFHQVAILLRRLRARLGNR